MRIKFDGTKAKTALMALVLLVAAVGGAAAAGYDAETTTTSTQSDASGTSNSLNLYPGDSAESLYLETDGAAGSGDNMTLKLEEAETGYVAYTNSSADVVNSSNGHFAFNVSHDELADLPRDSDGATYEAKVYNGSGDVVANTTITFSTPNDSDAVIAFADGRENAALTNAIADEVETSTTGTKWFGLRETNTSKASFSTFTTINGTDSTVRVLLDNSTAADAYSLAAEDTSSGEWITGATVFVQGEPMKVYKDEAPDSANGTTVVYDSSAETLEINLSGDRLEGADTLSVSSSANMGGYSLGTIFSNFGVMDALSTLNPL